MFSMCRVWKYKSTTLSCFGDDPCGLQTFNLTLQLMKKRMELSVPDSDLRQHEDRSERVRYSGYTCLSQMRIRIHFLIIFVRYSCLLLQLFIIFKA